jgi:HD-GYP domain-containing protein (c-di-GMP phosphodiesterase class II)
LAIELDLDQDAALEFSVRLLQVMRLMRLYDVDNVNLDDPIATLLKLVDRIASNAGTARLEIKDDAVYFNRDPVRGGRKAFLTLRDLTQALEQAGLCGVAFSEGLTVSLLRSFLGLLKDKPIPEVKAGLLELEVTDRIQIYAPGDVDTTKTEQAEIDDTFFPQAYGRTLVLVREYVRTIHTEEFQADLGQRLCRALRDLCCLVSKFEEKFIAMGSLKGVDEYLYTHMVNTGFLSLALGFRLGVARVWLSNLGYAAMLHAMGKAMLPRDLRENASHGASALTKLATHPYVALESLLGTRRASTKTFAAISAAFQVEAHRMETKMRLKPGPYPAAMIIRVCEEYDALTTTLPDRPALTPPEALATLMTSPPEHYDPGVLAVFGAMLGPLPAGSAVFLKSGHLGYVVRKNVEEPFRPLLAMLKDSDGKPLHSERLDMSQKGPDGKYLSSIRQVLDQEKLETDVSEHLLASPG